MRNELKATEQLALQTIQEYTDAVLRFHSLHVCNAEEKKWINRRLEEIVERVNAAIGKEIKEMYLVRDFLLDHFYDAELNSAVFESKEEILRHLDDDAYGVYPFENSDESKTYAVVEYENFAFEMINRMKENNARFISCPESIELLCNRIEAHYYEQRSRSRTDHVPQDSFGLSELEQALRPYLQVNNPLAILCYAQIAFDGRPSLATLKDGSYHINVADMLEHLGEKPCAGRMAFFKEKDGCFSKELAAEKLLENQLVDRFLYKRICCCAQNCSWRTTFHILQFIREQADKSDR